MKLSKSFSMLAVALLSLVAGYSQTPTLSPAATEVQRLVQSGVDESVVMSFIAQSQSLYNLSAADIAALKSDGVSSQAVTAMLNHDGSLRVQQQAANAASVTTSDTPAPAPQIEVIPVSPGQDFVWTPGYWSWGGHAWIWIGGGWHHPVRPGRVWVEGYWNGHGRSRAWVGGHWR